MGQFDDERRLSQALVHAAMDFQCGIALLAGWPYFEPDDNSWYQATMARHEISGRDHSSGLTVFIQPKA